MKLSIIFRVFLGLMIAALGGILLARNLEIITFERWDIFWGVLWGGLFILAGISAMITRRTMIVLWGVLLASIGSSIILGAFDVIDVNAWKLFWPVVLIGIGLSILFNYTAKPLRKKKIRTDSDKQNRTAVFYGENLQPRGDYTGGSLSALFGAIELDLRQAEIKDGAVIEVFTFCGGVEITVPDTVIVNNEVRGVLGGSEDKTAPKKGAKKNLYLRGECVLGGLQIK